MADPERLKRSASGFSAHAALLTMSAGARAGRTYRRGDRPGFPVLLVRGRDGALRAFANICRHRGAPVATDAASARVLVSVPWAGPTRSMAACRDPDERSFTAGRKRPRTDASAPASERHGRSSCACHRRTAGDRRRPPSCGTRRGVRAYRFRRYSSSARRC